MSGAVEGMALLSCPFCGWDAKASTTLDQPESHFVLCQRCETMGAYFATSSEAITAWNTRTTPPARSYADEGRVTIARALAERFIERGNARVTGSVHASWEAMPWSYRRDFLADADAVINVLSQGGKA